MSNVNKNSNVLYKDMISRQAAIDALGEQGLITAMIVVDRLPSVHPEPLTDKEQRIFLVAMRREEKVCEEGEIMKDESRLRQIMQEWEMYKEGGCYLCKYDDKQEWEMPCASCKRSHKDYWERKETK